MEVQWGSGVLPQPLQIRLSPVSGIIAEQHDSGERLEGCRLGNRADARVRFPGSILPNSDCCRRVNFNRADARVRFPGSRVEVGMTNPTDQDRIE